MGNELAEIQRLLHDQSISSSFLPLILITSIIFGGSLLFLFKLYQLFRIPKIKLPTTEAPARSKFSFRKWARLIPVARPAPTPVTTNGELDKLRALVKKLEEANMLERKQHASDLARISALQGELKSLTEKREDDRRLLDMERARNLKLEEKILALETQLQDAIRETERIFEQSAKVVNNASAAAQPKPMPPVADILKDFPPEPGNKD